MFYVESYLALCSRVIIFSPVYLLGEERSGLYVLLLLLFVYFARLKLCPFLFLLVSGFGCDL